MRVTDAGLPGVLLIEPDVHRDPRGFFLETYHADKFRALGITVAFVQDNHSQSSQGALRGLHLQTARPQAKLVRVIEGAIFDVAVDVRRGSPTFGKWCGSVLTAERLVECYIPPGFAHGFAVTSSSAQVEYKCSDVYDAACEIGIAWDDPALAIQWPLARPLLSDRDRGNPLLSDVLARLPNFAP